MSLKSRILAFLSSEEKPKEEVVALADLKLEDGTTITSEDWAEGSAVFIKGEEGEENVKLPVGDYQVDGKTLVVTEEGIIESMGEAKVEEPKEDEEPKEIKEEPKEELEEEVVEKVQEENVPTIDELIMVIGNLEERISQLEGGEQLNKEEPTQEGDVQLSAEGEEVIEDPKPIVHTPKEKTAPKGNGLYFGKGSIVN